MRMPVTRPLGVGVAILVLAVAGCADGDDDPAPSSSSTAPVAWPAPPDPLERTVAAGLAPEVKEFLTYHVHAHLDVFVNGEPVTVPAGIGINVDDPDVHPFTETDGSVSYGGIELCSTPCISPLHTHDTSGILHTESATPEPNTLGQFFIEWGVRLSGTCVEEYCSPTPIAFYLNGTPYMDDPGAIGLTDHLQIAVVIGTPPPEIPATADFSEA